MKKLLAILCCVTMLISLLSIGVFAEAPETGAGEAATEEATLEATPQPEAVETQEEPGEQTQAPEASTETDGEAPAEQPAAEPSEDPAAEPTAEPEPTPTPVPADETFEQAGIFEAEFTQLKSLYTLRLILTDSLKLRFAAMGANMWVTLRNEEDNANKTLHLEGAEQTELGAGNTAAKTAQLTAGSWLMLIQADGLVFEEAAAYPFTLEITENVEPIATETPAPTETAAGEPAQTEEVPTQEETAETPEPVEEPVEETPAQEEEIPAAEPEQENNNEETEPEAPVTETEPETEATEPEADPEEEEPEAPTEEPATDEEAPAEETEMTGEEETAEPEEETEPEPAAPDETMIFSGTETTGEPEATEEPEAPERRLMVTVTEASVRQEADGMSPILATLPEETEVWTLGVVNGIWVKVELPDETNGVIYGYIYNEELTDPAAESPDPEAETEPEEAPGTEEPESEETAAEPAEMSVMIFTSRRVTMVEGEDITLTSVLKGFEGYQVSYQWQCDRGAGFEDIEGANGDSYVYAASLESLSWNWRLKVSFE